MSTSTLPSGAVTPDRKSMRLPELADPVKSGRRWAETVDDAWDASILALDGGGIRGYSSLLIMRSLMHQIYIWEKTLEEREGKIDGEELGEEDDLLPCHYFDFMYGTSTGGLIAIMLGRLRMRIEECLDAYRMVGNKLFGHRRSVIPMATKYRHEPLEEAVKGIVGKHCHEHESCDGKDDLHPWTLNEEILSDPIPQLWDPEAPRVCQSCCLTATHNRSVIHAHLLRSYPHFYDDQTTPNWLTRYNQGADPLTIWQTTRATSAAPFYFELLAADINGEVQNFKDGGIRENNPSGAAWNEFHSLYASTGRTDPALLLSIGTGRSDQSQDGFATAWPGPLGHLTIFRKIFEKLEKFSVIPSLLVKFTESEKQHQTMRNYAQGEHTYYKRLNVDGGLESMPLDHWIKGLWKPLEKLGRELGIEEKDKNGSNEKTQAEMKPGGASLSKMEQATFAYLQREFDPDYDTYAPPQTMLDQTAEKLVRLRRARAKAGGPRWETFVGKGLKEPKNVDDRADEVLQQE